MMDRMSEVRCPDCNKVFNSGYLDTDGNYESEADQVWFYYSGNCPHCGKPVGMTVVYRFMSEEVYTLEDDE